MLNKTDERKGILFALATALVSGGAIVVNKAFVASVDPVLFTPLRLILVAFGFFLVLKFVERRSIGPGSMSKMGLLGVGVFGGGFAFLIFFTGLKLTTAGHAAFLHKTLPFFTAILAFFFLKEKIKDILPFLLLMFGGMYFVYNSPIGTDLWFLAPKLGDLLVLGATALWAIENTIARKLLMKEKGASIVSFYRAGIGSVVLILYAVMVGEWGGVFTLTMAQWAKVFASAGILFLYMYFWYRSLQYLRVAKAAGILLFAPVVSLILGVVFFGEPAPVMQLVGSAMILVAGWFLLKRKEVTVQEI